MHFPTKKAEEEEEGEKQTDASHSQLLLLLLLQSHASTQLLERLPQPFSESDAYRRDKCVHTDIFFWRRKDVNQRCKSPDQVEVYQVQVWLGKMLRQRSDVIETRATILPQSTVYLYRHLRGIAEVANVGRLMTSFLTWWKGKEKKTFSFLRTGPLRQEEERERLSDIFLLPLSHLRCLDGCPKNYRPLFFLRENTHTHTHRQRRRYSSLALARRLWHKLREGRGRRRKREREKRKERMRKGRSAQQLKQRVREKEGLLLSSWAILQWPKTSLAFFSHLPLKVCVHPSPPPTSPPPPPPERGESIIAMAAIYQILSSLLSSLLRSGRI